MRARAIILAAGTGTRLRPLTDDRPKCLVELLGASLLDRQTRVLKACGVHDIYVVAGHLSERIKEQGYRMLMNADYASTNMVTTLFCAQELMNGDSDLVVTYGDIVYEASVLEALLACKAPMCLAVDRAWRRYWQARMNDPLKDAETLRLDERGYIRDLGKKPSSYDEIEGQYLGLIRIRADCTQQMAEAYGRMDRRAKYDGKPFPQMFMTSFIQHLIDIGWPVQAVPIDNGWLEVDTMQDLRCYEELQRKGELQKFYMADELEGVYRGVDRAARS